MVVDARDGKIIRKKPLSGISGTPFITDIGFFEDIGYLVEYKDVINFSSTFNLRKYEFCSYEDDRVLWSGTGGLAPVGQGTGTTINAKVFSDSSAWFENYYTGNLYRLNLNSGDTLATVSSNLIASQLGLDTASVGALLGKLDSKYIRLRSDTVMALATDFQLDSTGIYQPRVFAAYIDGLTYSSINGYLMPLPTPPMFSRDIPFDEYHYVIDSSQVLWGKGYVKRILGTRSVIDGSIADSVLVIDSLYYDPDTASFRENAPYELYRNGEYLAYVESLIWPYFGDTSIVANQSRLRLYRGKKLLYEEIILDTLIRTGGVIPQLLIYIFSRTGR